MVSIVIVLGIGYMRSTGNGGCMNVICEDNQGDHGLAIGDITHHWNSFTEEWGSIGTSFMQE